MKINLTEKAQEELKKVLKSKDNGKFVRIYIAGFGWGGPSFGLALDELKEGDSKVEAGEFTFILEEHLVEAFKGFIIDYTNNWLRRGFFVTADREGSNC